MKNFDFLYNTVICSYLLMKKLTVLLALRHFSWLVSLTPLQASTWLPRMADWLKNGCRGCFVGACCPAARAPTPGIWLLGGLRVRECVLCTYSYAGDRLADWLALLRVHACVRCSCCFTKVKRFCC